MSDTTWYSLDLAKEALQSVEDGIVAEKVDFAISAVMETIADVLPTATAPVLKKGVAAATEAMNLLHSKSRVNRKSVDFVAGRLASVIDVLAYSTSATADEAAVAKARQKPYSDILQWLSDGAQRNADLVVKSGWNKAYVSRLLDELREMELVTSHRSGREVFNALTPAGRMIVDEGIQDIRRIPIRDGNVHNFGAARFNLAEIPGPENTQEAELPKLSAAVA